MSELALPTNTAPPAPALREPVDLVLFAQEASSVHRIAQALARSSFVPKPFQDRPDEITAAILFGRELHLSPMVSLQEIHVIQGRPTMSANSMRGLAMAHGVEFQVLDESDQKVVMRARNPRQEHWTTATWTIDRARRMDLLKKDNWTRQPQAMLNARCTSELCRKVAANVLIGMPYSVEELTDLTGAALPAALAEPEQPTKTVRRATPAYEAAEPEPEPAPQQEPPPEPEPGRTISPTTRRELMAVFGDLNVTDRNTRLGLVTEWVGREVHSVNQLTEVEARTAVRQARDRLADKVWPEPAPVPESAGAPA